MVKALIEWGADVNSEDQHGDRVVHWAATNSDVGVVRALIGSRVDVNVRDILGKTPLFLACKSGNPATSSQLAHAAACEVCRVSRVDPPDLGMDHLGRTALYFASKFLTDMELFRFVSQNEIQLQFEKGKDSKWHLMLEK